LAERFDPGLALELRTATERLVDDTAR